MQPLSLYEHETKHNARCAAAIESLKLFMADARNKSEDSLSLSTLELIVGTIEPAQKELSIPYDNSKEIAYES